VSASLVRAGVFFFSYTSLFVHHPSQSGFRRIAPADKTAIAVYDRITRLLTPLWLIVNFQESNESTNGEARAHEFCIF
jgi:hypothetical protein